MIKKLIARIIIPKNTPYCHYRIKHNKKKDIYTSRVCPYWTEKDGREYCKYLKQELHIQDQVKDCGINEYRRD